MTTQEPCPSCRKEGHDSSGDNLTRWPEGNAHCVKCGYKEYKGQQPMQEGTLSTLTVEQIQSFPLGVDPARKIDPSIGEQYGVRVSYDESSGKEASVHYPYGRKGPVSYKNRKLGVPKKQAFSNSGAPVGLFGQSTCTKKTEGVLFITEGEEDALAAKHMLTIVQPVAEADVVSLPNGAKLDKTTTKEFDFFDSYNKILICVDNDDAGEDAMKELADWLSRFCAVKVVNLDPALGKDASDYLVGGHERAFRKAIKDAVAYEPEGIMNGTDISLDSMLVPEEEGFKFPFQGLQDKLHGIRKGEIITLCAGSGIGKTTMMREIVKSLIEQGQSVANIALEDQMKVTAQAMVALDMDIPLTTFRFRPPAKSEVQPHYDKMIGNGKTFFFKHFGGLDSSSLMSTLYTYARAKSVDFIILDHLSMVVSSTRTTNERKEIDTLMTDLAAMVVETGVGLIQIVHLKRTSGDKSYAHGGEVELTDLRGSAALEQLSWAVVGMERDQQGDDHNFSRVRILKNRTFGFTGLCDTLYYNPLTGRMKNVEVQPELPKELPNVVSSS